MWWCLVGAFLRTVVWVGPGLLQNYTIGILFRGRITMIAGSATTTMFLVLALRESGLRIAAATDRLTQTLPVRIIICIRCGWS